MSSDVDDRLTDAMHRIAAAHVPDRDSSRSEHRSFLVSDSSSSDILDDGPVAPLRSTLGQRQRAAMLGAAAAVIIGVVGLAVVASRPTPATSDNGAVSSEPHDAPTSAAPAQVVEPPPRLSAEQLFLDAALAPDQAVADRYDEAVALHRETCMAEAGFTEAPALASLAPSASSFEPMVDFLYFDDDAAIADYGYFWPQRFGTTAVPSEQPEVSPEMSTALDRCNQPIIAIVQQAYRTGGLVGVVPGQIDGQIFGRVSSRREVEDRYSAWKKCMTDTGYPDARLREPIDPETIETIEQASQDASCRKTTGYTNAVVTAQADEVARWLAANPETVEAFERLWNDIATAAAELS